jgi:transcriptional regulator with GAF, ATPase, and Fis domain
MERKRTLRTITAVNPLKSGVSRPASRMFIVHPKELRGVIELRENIIAFGRSQTAKLGEVFIEIGDDTVSRSHFVMAWADDTWLLKDMGSRNGTWVDGAKVSDEFVPLADNAVVRAGYVVFVFEVGEAPSSDAGAGVSTAAIPGQAAATLALRAAVGRAARDPSPALVFGETGVGKELIASEIHRLSGRSGTLVAINCAALSPQLVESQLFGHERGAFTGAEGPQAGYFRAANGGTLFLDEVGELPLTTQPKLLRAIQEGVIQPVGSTKTLRVDTRIVAATNRDLARLVEDGSFRRDLYARLSLWEITAPKLSRRRADLVMWLEIFHARWLRARGLSADPLCFDALAVEALLHNPWRENLRGLDRLVHELASRPPQTQPVSPHDLPAWALEPLPGKSAPQAPLSREAPGSPSSRAALPSSAAASGEPPSRAPSSRDPEITASRPSLDLSDASAPEPQGRIPPPSREELLQVLKQLGGSIRATAKHFDRDRRQIYRWIRSYGIGDDEV